MKIQWYPGHMNKTRKLLMENLKLVDIVIELLDARIPYSSKNPLFEELLLRKPRIIVLNKHDLADPAISDLWVDWYVQQGETCVCLNSVTGKGVGLLLDRIHNTMSSKVNAMLGKGLRNYRIKSMVVGIPNVGKSSLINKVAGKNAAKTGNKPGVTRGKQWIRMSRNIDLLDTPGILWPKFNDRRIASNVAFTGAIKDEVMDTEEIASGLMVYIAGHYGESIKKRYGLNNLDTSGLKMLEEAGKNRGCIMSGGIVDTLRTSNMVLDEFRGGKLGGISLERPDEAHVKRL